MKKCAILLLNTVPFLSFSELKCQPYLLPPSVRSESVDLLDTLFFVKAKNGAGSSFLLQEQADVWLVSNSHVFERQKDCVIQNQRGETIDIPEIIQVASDRDLFRFKTSRPSGLLSAHSCNCGEKIYAYGDSGGAGALTQLSGTVLTISSNYIEVSAQIISGNSGGPILNENNEVIGVSTFLFNQNRNNEQEKTHRIATTFNQVKWIETPFNDYRKQSAQVIDTEDNLLTLIAISTALSSNITTGIVYYGDNHYLKNWIKQHNRMAKNAFPAESGFYGRQARRSLLRKIKSSLRELISTTKKLEGKASHTDMITLPYFKQRMDLAKDRYRACREQLEIALQED